MQSKKSKECGQWDLVPTADERHRLIRESLHASMQESMLFAVHEMFQIGLETLCGEAWSRKDKGKHRRGGSEKGSIYLDGQRVSVVYPRVATPDGSRALPEYIALRDFDLFSEAIQKGLIRGVSTRDYSDVVGTVVDGTGLSRTTISRGFARASQKSLDTITGRDLSDRQYLALFLDGIEFKDTLLVVALGISTEGEKAILGLAEGHTENAEVVSQLLDNLMDRGLSLTDRFLAVLDGSKALHAAVRRRFGRRGEIQRCQIHKKRNVKAKLPKGYHAELVRRLNVAYGMRNIEEARKLLQQTVRWLESISEPAARSLEEGMEETLTVIRLELPDALRRTFATTNPIESPFDGVRSRTRRVKNWKQGKGRMAARWVAAGLLEAEKRFRKIRGYRSIGLLQSALEEQVIDEQRKRA